MNKKIMGKSINIVMDLVNSRAPDKMDKGTLISMSRSDIRNISDKLFIQIPIKFQIIENDEPKVGVSCELIVNGHENTGIGTTNNDGIIEWDNHKEVSEIIEFPISCDILYEDKKVNINITEVPDKELIIIIEDGRLKGEDNMIYSLDEIEIGVLGDKKVYQRCFNCGFKQKTVGTTTIAQAYDLTTGDSLSNEIISENIDQILEISGTYTLFFVNKYTSVSPATTFPISISTYPSTLIPSIYVDRINSKKYISLSISEPTGTNATKLDWANNPVMPVFLRVVYTK